MISPAGWEALGFAGQGIFTSRFLVQWAASEKKKDSVVPVAFWWLSLGGGLALLAYAASKHDRVIMLGQGMGLIVYVRNLMLVTRKSRRERRAQLAGPHRMVPQSPPVGAACGMEPDERVQ